MPDQDHAKSLQDQYEIQPDPQGLTGHSDPQKNSSTGVDYEPNPSESISLSPEREHIVQSICRLYSGSATKDGTGEQDMQVYAQDAVYDDPWSYCDTRYKIAGQWYGIPKVMSSSRTLKTQVVASESDRIIFKMQQEYTPRVLHTAKAVNSLVTLTLDKEEKVRYHKDMWNDKDYSHRGIGKVLKEMNGDNLTAITRPPKDL